MKRGAFFLIRQLKTVFSNSGSYFDSRLSFSLNIMRGKILLDETVRENMKYLKGIIPPLTRNQHKGQCGRIAVIGGTAEYTGAPYFAAISSLKLGADVANIICCKEAAVPIKSYNPAVIVYPYLDHSDVISKTKSCLDRIHCLVIGPGLGRDPDVFKNVKDIITYCNMKLNSPTPLIFDADGLYFVNENLDLIKEYRGIVALTPNAVEATRLCEKFNMTENQMFEIATELNALILRKGECDVITNGLYQKILKLPPEYVTARNRVVGSSCRSAGQGDILAGCLATFIAWYIIEKKSQLNTDQNDVFILQPPTDPEEWDLEKRKNIFDNMYKGFTAACFGASLVTRRCSLFAFEKIGRGMTATEMVHFIPKVFNQYFH